MNIERIDTSTETRLSLTGRFDAHQTMAFRTLVKNIYGNICIDLRGVGFIDSSGLAALVSTFGQCRQNNSRLRIVNLQDAVRLIFELTKLMDILPIELLEVSK